MLGFNPNTFNPLNFVSQAALATVTGGTSLLVQQLTTQLISSIGQQIIQNVGQQLGVPQSVIDIAKGGFAAEVGDFQGASSSIQDAMQNVSSMLPGASALAQGALQSGVDAAQDAGSSWAKSFIENQQDQDQDGNVKGGRSQGGAASWLMAIAKGLANMLNTQADKLEAKMKSTNWDKAGQAAEYQAQSQEFGLAMNTATNAIKTIGEALSTMARKG
jgi:hypothetical protein